MQRASARSEPGPDTKILIVEDEFFLALEVEMSLLDAGYRVVGHGVSLRTARAVADEEKPDLALVDLRLADGATGLDVAADLKKRGVACLIISGACAGDAGRDVALGCLHKPFDNETLLQAVACASAAIHGAPDLAAPPGMHLYAPVQGAPRTAQP